MHNLEQGKSLTFENVASFRRKLNLSDIKMEVENFRKLIREKGAVELGPMISTTYEVKEVKGEQVLDIEFLIKIDSEISLEKPYRFLNKFYLTNAVFTRYIGDPSKIEETVNSMYLFVHNHDLVPITTLYNVTINSEGTTMNGNGTPVIDLYLPVNPNEV